MEFILIIHWETIVVTWKYLTAYKFADFNNIPDQSIVNKRDFCITFYEFKELINSIPWCHNRWHGKYFTFRYEHKKIPTVLFSILKFLPDANEEQVDPKKNYANKQIKKSNWLKKNWEKHLWTYPRRLNWLHDDRRLVHFRQPNNMAVNHEHWYRQCVM